jgi:hypothetical protein
LVISNIVDCAVLPMGHLAWLCARVVVSVVEAVVYK